MATPNNLPAEVSSFVGREQQLAELRRLLHRSRLVTLTGPGGAGKTRLALRLATSLLDHYRDGVWLVELASVSDARLLDQTVASACRIREEKDRQVVEALISGLTGRTTLLVLDSTEHIVDTSAALANRLLRSCRDLTLLVTSREPLGVPGELIWRTPSLSLPRPEDAGRPELLLQSEAVRLFVDRTKLSRPAFELDPATSSAVSSICSRLEGIPLAIELAAGLTGVMTFTDILEGLSDRFRLLTGGGRGAVPRHQTLRQAVDWSYGLLSPPEQALFVRLAAFSGGFDLAAVKDVAEGEPVARDEVMALLQRLVAKSLVTAESSGAQHTRYEMLETIREYALDKLEESEKAELRRRHARYFVDWAAGAARNLDSRDTQRWLDLIDHEQANIRLALDWTVSEQPDAALRLASAMGRYWLMRGRNVEGIEWLGRVLDAAPSMPSARVHALLARARLQRRAGQFDGATRDAEESARLSRALGLAAELSGALTVLGLASSSGGDWASAERFHTEALNVAVAAGEVKRAAVSQNNLALVELGRGQPEPALARLIEALSKFEGAGDQYTTARFLESMARIRFRLGQYEAARRTYLESLSLAAKFDDAATIADVCDGMALLAMVQKQPERVVLLVATATSLRRRYASEPMPEFVQQIQEALTKARAAIGPPAAEAAVRRADSFNLRQAIELASGAQPRTDDAGTVPLSARELEIARLIAGGLTNAEVGQKLHISDRTVDAHVEHIRNKLGLRSRSQIAVWTHEKLGNA